MVHGVSKLGNIVNRLYYVVCLYTFNKLFLCGLARIYWWKAASASWCVYLYETISLRLPGIAGELRAVSYLAYNEWTNPTNQPSACGWIQYIRSLLSIQIASAFMESLSYITDKAFMFCITLFYFYNCYKKSYRVLLLFNLAKWFGWLICLNFKLNLKHNLRID